MANRLRFHPRTWALIGLGILFACYVLYQARYLVFGPQVWIDAPRDGIVASPIVTVTGRAENAAWITLNGAQIFTDKEGRWSERLLAPLGSSIMTVTVRDRFGRERSQELRLIYN